MPCCISTVTLSQPQPAITSAEKPEGIASQPLTQALPDAIRALSLFAMETLPRLSQKGCEEGRTLGARPQQVNANRVRDRPRPGSVPGPTKMLRETGEATTFTTWPDRKSVV